MEKSFSVDAATRYEVVVSYKFATADFGDINLFRIICGVSTTSQETVDDPTFQDDTGHHLDTQEGFVWVNKSYTLSIVSDEQETLYVSIGVWGTWETQWIYYVDDVNISIQELDSKLFPDLSGNWTLSYYNWEGNLKDTQNVTIEQIGYTISLTDENETLGTGTLLKNYQSLPVDNISYIISGLDFAGLGINIIYVHNQTSMKTELPLCENCNPAVFSRTL